MIKSDSGLCQVAVLCEQVSISSGSIKRDRFFWANVALLASKERFCSMDL